MRPERSGGFTLIEMLIVVSLISILTAIFMPKYEALVSGSKEAATRGGLGSLRTAVSLYFASTGVYPHQNLTEALIPQFLEEIPACWTSPHAASRQISDTAAFLTDQPGWGYWTADSPTHRGASRLFVSCSHQDSNGKIWSRH